MIEVTLPPRAGCIVSALPWPPCPLVCGRLTMVVHLVAVAPGPAVQVLLAELRILSLAKVHSSRFETTWTVRHWSSSIHSIPLILEWAYYAFAQRSVQHLVEALFDCEIIVAAVWVVDSFSISRRWRKKHTWRCGMTALPMFCLTFGCSLYVSSTYLRS